MAVLLETNVGDIVVDLFTKEKPLTCKNFIKLCKLKYYNFCLFYNVKPYFVAQTGDPTNSGQGGRSVYGICGGKDASFPKEEYSSLKHSKAGTLSMVVDPRDNSHRSQFFFTLAANLTRLDSEHSPFGVVAEGLDVLLKLNDAILDENGRPLKDYRINRTIILDDPFDDPPRGFRVPERSPSPTTEQLENFRIGADQEDNEDNALSKEEAEEKLKEQEARAQAQILELVGDLPSADVKPPENVLFVCKLNPATDDDDLKLIFSRFGRITSCHIVRDIKTGDSLQYAFVEFENVADCEKAYLKMENVLIDDRRIHVDFSQSVAMQSKASWFKQYFQSKKHAGQTSRAPSDRHSGGKAETSSNGRYPPHRRVEKEQRPYTTSYRDRSPKPKPERDTTSNRRLEESRRRSRSPAQRSRYRYDTHEDSRERSSSDRRAHRRSGSADRKQTHYRDRDRKRSPDERTSTRRTENSRTDYKRRR